MYTQNFKSETSYGILYTPYGILYTSYGKIVLFFMYINQNG